MKTEAAIGVRVKKSWDDEDRAEEKKRQKVQNNGGKSRAAFR